MPLTLSNAELAGLIFDDDENETLIAARSGWTRYIRAFGFWLATPPRCRITTREIADKIRAADPAEATLVTHDVLFTDIDRRSYEIYTIWRRFEWHDSEYKKLYDKLRTQVWMLEAALRQAADERIIAVARNLEVFLKYDSRSDVDPEIYAMVKSLESKCATEEEFEYMIFTNFEERFKQPKYTIFVPLNLEEVKNQYARPKRIAGNRLIIDLSGLGIMETGPQGVGNAEESGREAPQSGGENVNEIPSGGGSADEGAEEPRIGPAGDQGVQRESDSGSGEIRQNPS